MAWTRLSIIRELKRLHKREADLSYNNLADKRQSLVSAASYHFGSYRQAIERAGIDYAEITRRPRWTKPRIIALIKAARRDGDDLHWSAVTKRRDALGKAAFASLQPRLFRQWARALHAAGLDADEISRYRTWDPNTICFELRERRSGGESLASGDVQREQPALHAAALRQFKSYDQALKAAGINPAKARRRRKLDRPSTLTALLAAKRRLKPFTEATLRRADPSLFNAALRQFKTFARAISAAK